MQHYEQDKAFAPADVYDHLGMIKEKLNLTAEAIDAYKQAMTVGAEELPEKTRERIEQAIERLSL